MDEFKNNEETLDASLDSSTSQLSKGIESDRYKDLLSQSGRVGKGRESQFGMPPDGFRRASKKRMSCPNQTIKPLVNNRYVCFRVKYKIFLGGTMWISILSVRIAKTQSLTMVSNKRKMFR
jgi:hypothetical protein